MKFYKITIPKDVLENLPSRGNCFYYASNMLTMLTVLEMTKVSEPLKALDRFFKEVLEATGWFLTFLNFSLMAMAEKNGWKNGLITE